MNKVPSFADLKLLDVFDGQRVNRAKKLEADAPALELELYAERRALSSSLEDAESVVVLGGDPKGTAPILAILARQINPSSQVSLVCYSKEETAKKQKLTKANKITGIKTLRNIPANLSCDVFIAAVTDVNLFQNKQKLIEAAGVLVLVFDIVQEGYVVQIESFKRLESMGFSIDPDFLTGSVWVLRRQ